MGKGAPTLSRILLGICLAATTAAASEIEGIVLDIAGEPVPEATVRIDSIDRSVLTGDDGTFVLAGLEEGQYQVKVVAFAYAVTARKVRVAEGGTARVEFQLRPLTGTETVEVTASYSMFGDKSGPGTSLNREDIENLPHFGNDLYRGIGVLPSTTANDVSSQFSVRGGLGRENLVMLDGLEIFEPFHLKDYEGVFSIFDPGVIGGAELYPGAFSAKYGDRSAAVLDMDSLTPSGTTNSLGMSFSNFWFNSSGEFDGSDGNWVVSVRRGFLGLVFDLAGANDDEGEEATPAYTDLFGKVSWWVTPRQNLAVNVLLSDDTLDLRTLSDGDDVTADTSYGNRYVWLTHRMVPAKGMFVRTVLALGQLDRDRSSVGEENGDRFVIRDVRETDTITLKQDWTFEMTERHALDWGFEVRSYDTKYDYESTIDIARVIPDPRFRPPTGAIDFDETVEGDYYSAYVSSRFRPAEKLSAEAGMRLFRSTLTEENHLAPRVSLLWNASEKNTFNAGWGHIYQTHRPYELDVQDGETTFFDAEKAEHWVLGYERRFDPGWTLRAEAYLREIDNPRVRYENLFQPINQFPEASYDRIRVAATDSSARGIELLLRAPSTKRFDWWASYVYSRIEETVDGRDQRRRFDQPHAVTVNVNYKPSPKWNLNAVWYYHTGWPSTDVTAESVPGPGGPQIVPIVGPFYDERLSVYHRLDLRASYTKQMSRSRLVFFLDVQNFYGRENQSGFEYEDGAFMLQPDGSVLVDPETEEWLGRLPSFGIRWDF